MSWLQALILGVIQGLTEFLPISSSAHLVLVPDLLGWRIPEAEAFVFNVLVQDATLVAVILYFWKDLWGIAGAFLRGLLNRRPFEDPQARLGWHLIVATLPAVFFGFLIKKSVEAAFASPPVTAALLLFTALLLILAERLSHRTRALDINRMNWQDAFWIGMFQALAVFPGISRSGTTITGGMLRSLSRPEAARFSFLMSIPVMFGAGLLAMLDLVEIPHFAGPLLNFLPGFLAAGLVGYLSIRWLIGYLSHRPLYGFAAYCAAIGLITLLVYLF